MKKFRVKNLTVAVDSSAKLKPGDLKKCGPAFSCPGGPVGSFCGFSHACNFKTINCDGITIHCFTGSVNCGPVLTLGCGISNDGCGVNFSTLHPTDWTEMIKVTPELTDKLELIESFKADLNVALSNLEGAQKELSSAAQPQTLEEAKEVEANLEAALKEVKSLKKTLK